MTRIYHGLLSFYAAYRKPKFHVTNEDVDELVSELRKNANVRINADAGRVTVLEHSNKYEPQKKHCRLRYTKLSADIPRALAADFSAACKTLGVSQTSVLKPLLEATIAKARDAMQN